MNVALINQNVCENVAVFDALELAKEMLGDVYQYIVECPDNRGIPHRYINGTWYNPQPHKDANGIYPYEVDMCVNRGDLVYGLDNRVYKALNDIEYQQLPPEELSDQYEETDLVLP